MNVKITAETLRYDDGRFRLRLPLAITPRYLPGGQSVPPSDGMGPAPTQALPDTDRITPPFVARSEGQVLPVRIDIELERN